MTGDANWNIATVAPSTHLANMRLTDDSRWITGDNVLTGGRGVKAER